MVVLVKLDRPQGEILGGVVAAPVFSAVLADILPYLGVPPSDYVAQPDLLEPVLEETGANPGQPTEGEEPDDTAAPPESATPPAGADEAGVSAVADGGAE